MIRFFSFFLISIILLGQKINPPIFSHESGFYDSSFNLILSHSNPNAKIIYTVDGSEPDINNLEGTTYQYKKQYPVKPGELPSDFPFYENTFQSNLYLNSIFIYNRTLDPNIISNIPTSFIYQDSNNIPNDFIDKLFVVRAKVYLDDHDSVIITKAYFINNNMQSLPIMLINTNEDKLFGYEDGMWVPGKQFDKWRNDNLSANIDMWTPSNYWVSGSSSEIEANILYFDNMDLKINQNIGVRNHGNGTRPLPNRSFRFYAKSDYGKKSIDYNFFKDYNYDSFRRVIIRNSDRELTMFRDPLVQVLNSHLNFETQNYQPITTYVNGEYYGIFNVRERFDEKYFERVFGLKEEEIDFIENDGIVDLGDDIFFKKTINFFKNNNLSNNLLYEEALTYVDEINFVDYYIAEIFSANYDWPQNNNEFFRKRVSFEKNAKYGHDGRWRWVFKDLDMAFNGDKNWAISSYEFDMINHAKSNIFGGFVYENTIFNSFLNNQIFNHYFINRFADLMNTIYKPNYLISLIDSMQNNLRDEMPRYIKRWRLIPSMEAWEENVEDLRIFAKERPKFQKKHLLDYFKLEGVYNVAIQNNDESKGFVKINTIEINNSTLGIGEDYLNWTGEYFKGIPIKIEAVALPGYKFLKWEGDIVSTDRILSLNQDKDIKIKPVFGFDFLSKGDYERVDFLLYPNPSSGVLNIESREDLDVNYRIFNLLGQNIESGKVILQKINIDHLEKGIYLIELKQGDKRNVKKFIKK